MSSAPSALPGVRYGRHASFFDARGSFREIWRASSFPVIPDSDAGVAPGAQPTFVQANLSTSEPGVLRGLHYHRRQLDFWTVMSGSAFVALVDVRPSITGTSEPILETRVLAADEWVVIPAGVAHGFLALEALQLLYLVTNEYDGSDELGFAWDDQAVAISWPRVRGGADGRPILSDRDRSNPTLAALITELRG